MSGKIIATLLALVLSLVGAGLPGYAAAESITGFNPLAPLPGGYVGSPERGGKLFLQRCATCHGESGNGRGPRAVFLTPKPRDFLTENFREKFDRPRIYAAVALGKLGTEMPAWLKDLPEQDVADVSEYVFQRFVLNTIDISIR